MKPLDTRQLAHECGVKAVKASYSSVVLALENVYETSHESEALGQSKALFSHSTIAAMFLLDYILPKVAKLSRALQAKDLDHSLISSLVDATLIHLMMLYCLQQIGFYSYKLQGKSLKQQLVLKSLI